MVADDGTPGKRSIDELLAVELAAGKTVRAAAECLGIAERTAYRRLRDRQFVAMVRQLRAEIVQTATAKLVNAMTQAVAGLVALTQDQDANIRLRACSKLLELGYRADDSTRLEAEIDDLRQAIDRMEKR